MKSLWYVYIYSHIEVSVSERVVRLPTLTGSHQTYNTENMCYDRWRHRFKQATTMDIYIYIYIYVCVCVRVYYIWMCVPP